MRRAVFAFVLAGAFFYFTTYRSGHLQPTNWISHPARVEITEAAGGDVAGQLESCRPRERRVGIAQLPVAHDARRTRLDAEEDVLGDRQLRHDERLLCNRCDAMLERVAR